MYIEYIENEFQVNVVMIMRSFDNDVVFYTERFMVVSYTAHTQYIQ